MTRTFVYVSAAAAGVIDVFALDAGGGLAPLASIPAGPVTGPMALSPDRRHLYAAIRSEPYRVVTFAIDHATGRLNEVASAPLPASMPYIAVAGGGRLLLAASYHSNLAAALSIEPDGAIRARAPQILATHDNAHAIVPDRTGGYAVVPCLGSDVVMAFRIDGAAGRLEPLRDPPAGVPAGFGPRHAVFSADNRTLFVLGEFTGEIARFAFDESNGALDLIDITPTVDPAAELTPGRIRSPEPRDRSREIWAADLQISPDGRFLYATERTGSTIAAIAFDAAGALHAVGRYPTEVQPRGIRIDPDGRFLVASGERSDRIASYAIDPATGVLSPAGGAPVSAGANWVEIVAFD
jgi:6-phosphogluconolactonase